jgi:hypothetical protein
MQAIKEIFHLNFCDLFLSDKQRTLSDGHSNLLQTHYLSIWIVLPDYLGGPTIGGEPNITYGSYRWDAWGTMLVFQRTFLGGDSENEIAIYQLATGQVQVLAEDGGKPLWLP